MRILLLCRTTQKPLSSSGVCEARVKQLSGEKEKQQILGEFRKTPKNDEKSKGEPSEIQMGFPQGAFARMLPLSYQFKLNSAINVSIKL